MGLGLGFAMFAAGLFDNFVALFEFFSCAVVDLVEEFGAAGDYVFTGEVINDFKDFLGSDVVMDFGDF